MTAPFDPYHKWLGIPPKDQPPHHYRLLGIELFEEDAEVIESAANRLMAYLHEVATGDSSAQSQKLLNEIAAARVCLLNPERKAEYDKQLTARLRPRQPEASTVSPKSAQPAVTVGPSPVRPRPKTSWPLWLGGGIVTVAAVTLLLVLLPGLLSREDSGEVRPDREERVAATTNDTIAARKAKLVLDWPTGQRAEANLWLNQKNRAIPPSDRIEFPLEAGPLQIRIERAGYVEILWDYVVARGEIVRFSPAWVPVEANSENDPQPGALGQAAPSPDRSTGMPNAKAKGADPVRDLEPDRSGSPATRSTTADFPAVLDLPVAGIEGSEAWTTVIDNAGEGRLQLQLVGGETLLQAGAFQLTSRPSDQANWIVHLVDKGEQREEVAAFRCSASRLEFRWHGQDVSASADQLRNALLQVTAGSQRALLPLRASETVEPVRLAGPRGEGRASVRIDSLPDVSRLKLKILRATGTTSFAKRFEDRMCGVDEPLAVDLGAAELDFPLEVELELHAQRTGARLVQIKFNLWYRSYAGSRERLTVRNVVQDLALAQRNQQQRSGIANQQQLDQLQRIINYYAQLEGIARGTTPVDLHYQILFDVGPAHVVVAASADSP